MSKQKILQILLMATRGEVLACQLPMNEVGTLLWDWGK